MYSIVLLVVANTNVDALSYVTLLCMNALVPFAQFFTSTYCASG